MSGTHVNGMREGIGVAKRLCLLTEALTAQQASEQGGGLAEAHRLQGELRRR